MTETVRHPPRFSNVFGTATKYLLVLSIFGLVIDTMVVLYSKEVECQAQGSRGLSYIWQRNNLKKTSQKTFMLPERKSAALSGAEEKGIRSQANTPSSEAELEFVDEEGEKGGGRGSRESGSTKKPKEDVDRASQKTVLSKPDLAEDDNDNDAPLSKVTTVIPAEYDGNDDVATVKGDYVTSSKPRGEDVTELAEDGDKSLLSSPNVATVKGRAAYENGGESSTKRIAQVKLKSSDTGPVLHLYTKSKVPRRVDPKELIDFHQEDPWLIQYVRTYYIYPPSEQQPQPSRCNAAIESTKGEEVTAKGLDVNAKSSTSSILRVVQQILKNKTNGIFIDAGAYDGATDSVTLALEKKFNWTGLLIEGSPSAFPLLRFAHRKVWTSDVLLSPLSRPQMLLFSENVAKLTKNESMISNNDDGTRKYEEWTLLGIPLYTLVSALEVTEVDFLYLNVQNEQEGDILHWFPFDQVRVQTVYVNVSKLHTSKQKAVLKMMRAKGYFTHKGEQYFIFVYEGNNVEKSPKKKGARKQKINSDNTV